MGWNYDSEWKTKQDDIDGYARMVCRSGCNVKIEGNWFYAKKNGEHDNLIYYRFEILGGGN
jgi:hypothetical protein